jgi:hypothetical protein
VARDHYIRARDLDGFPVRCRSEMAEIYREIAATRHAVLIDGPEVLRPLTAHGILDDTLFHDAHHYTLATDLALGGAMFDALAGRRAFGLEPVEPSRGPTQPDLADWARRLGVDNPLWATVCARSGTYYMHLASARFDPAEREKKQERYFKAARALESGRSTAEALGIPGIGTSPAPSYPADWFLAVPSPTVSGGIGGANNPATPDLASGPDRPFDP